MTQDLASTKVYCEFLAHFDINHYNHFMWLGQINAVLGDRTAARAYLRKAIEICEDDKDWPRKSLQPIIDSITEELKQLGEEF